MRTLTVFLALLLPIALFAQEQKAAPASISRLAWLAGSWRMEKGGRVLDEQWMAPAGGVMLGIARTVAKGKVIEYEFTQIREGPGGELFYIAQPAKQKEAAFKVIAQTDTEVVFENKEHDFPQTIAYSLRADGTMLAYVEGPKADGTTRRIEYSYRRVQP
ncbi:MAG TPA: DUF6265 family protein [Lacunisphaera sp.]